MDNFIKEICFTEDWIKNKRKHTSDNITLIEKTIHAFALLGYLVQSEFEFIFKGGTCILLHVPIVKRLSIDIDIIFGGNIDDFQKFLSEIPGNSPFTRYEEDERGARGLPNRKHFKFFYLSSISNEEESVLLDIVLEDIEHIQYTESKLIKTEYFDTVFDLSANIPTIEGLLGDKLTAFAPHTIGVPFKTEKGDSMTMQVAKQLFDIGELFNIATDFDKLSKSFRNTYTVESTYRENTFTEEHVLHDIIDISALICHINLTGYKDREDSDNIKDGVSRLVIWLITANLALKKT
jgi:hypothetical protein